MMGLPIHEKLYEYLGTVLARMKTCAACCITEFG